MTYEGKSVSVRGSGRSYSSVKKHPARKRLQFADKFYIKAIVCGILLLAMILIKFVVPETEERIRESALNAVMGDVDYKSAITALGQAMGGEKKLIDAISEAYTYAFNVSSDKVETSAIHAQEKITKTETALEVVEHVMPVDIEKEAEENGIDEKNEEEVNIEIDEPENVNEKETKGQESVVSAFKESQSAYADVALPANVTYDMPLLEIDGICPATGAVSSNFGYREHPSDGQVRFHYGTDVAADKGTAVSAFSDGTVYAMGESNGYGLYIMLEHGGGVQTLYGHLDEVLVSGGDTVTKGEKIGKVGETGNATGPCLHFEMTVDGTYVNPEYYVSW